MTGQEWIAAFGPRDPASYARAGREIVAEGWVKTTSEISIYLFMIVTVIGLAKHKRM